MNCYKVLNKQIFTSGDFDLVPIRMEDLYDIMQWRNEQIYHLRQNKPLAKEDQDAYFKNVVSKLFNQEQPNQILFSFLEKDVCIGYGGLVHINWIDKNAEVSFIMNTSLEKDRFQEIWVSYLKLIEQVAFDILILHKIYTYAFDLRPHLYKVLEAANFREGARLIEHAIFENKAIDVLIHSKINQNLRLVTAGIDDLLITYRWATDEHVRKYSFNQNEISFKEHEVWFTNKLNDAHCFYYILNRGAERVGSIRIDFNSSIKEGLISYLIGSEFHGKGYGTKILQLVEKKFKEEYDSFTLKGLVLEENKASVKIFEKLGYHVSLKLNGVSTYIKTIKK
jgi:RimJ/RimL family protein N-acetyltransferase